MKLVNGTIRTRLLVGFLLSTLLPILIITLVSLVVGYRNGRQQVIDRLDSVSALKGQEIQSVANSYTNELVIALNEEYALDRINVVLNLADEKKFSQYFNKAVRWRFQLFLQQSEYLEELFLVDPYGRVVLSTDIDHEGANISLKENFFTESADSYIRIISPSKEHDQATIYSVLPIPGLDRARIGALVGKSNADSLEALLFEQHNIGKTGKILLLDPDSIVIASSTRDDLTGKLNNGFKISTTGSKAATKSRMNGSAIYHDHLGVRVLGAYRWLPEFDIALLVEQDLAEAFNAIYSTLVISIGVAFASALISVAFSLIITRSISNPLEKLVKTAASITSGDFETVADIDRRDEIGVLAAAFNSMTVQLKSLFTSLEQRVEERTRALQQVNSALEQRAFMLHTSSQVSRQITSILYLSDLLSRVVESIKQAFDYYHVQVYLVDHENGRLVPGAASGMQGVDRQTLAIGPGSVNGQAVQTNQAVVVDDVSQYPNFLYDDDLPLTRSELVAPLRVGDEVIGALDIQSSKNNAFTPEDVLIIQSLADQLAIAIENTRLYKQARQVAATEERQRLARELHDSVIQSLYSVMLLGETGQRVAKNNNAESAAGHMRRLVEISHQALKEMRLLVYELRPPELEQDGLAGALQKRLDAVENRAGLKARLLVERDVELQPEIEQVLYRIALEALNNALKHANATSVTIQILFDREWVELSVTDNGRGFDPVAEAKKGGMGLVAMQERVSGLKGDLIIRSTLGEGTCIQARVKLEQAGQQIPLVELVK